jgi:glycine/D-amino acid oxidase-like deaminating enzyme
MNHIIEEEDIECHYSRSGWLKLAASEVEEKSFYDDAAFAEKTGLAHITILTPEEIFSKYNMTTNYCGRLIKKSGNYHPVMFVHGIINHCLKTPNLKLYTNSQVVSVEYGKHMVRLGVKTTLGLQIIKAKKLIMATNGLCTDVIPELRFVQPWQSEIMTMEHATDSLQQLTVTDNQGYLYYHFRPERSYSDLTDGKRKGLLLFGGPDALPSGKNESKFNESILRTMIKEVNRSFPSLTGQPPSRFWTGTMGFTSDLIPIIDCLHGGRLTLAVAFNGFGGTFCILAGKLAATLAVEGRTPEVEQFAPYDMFGIGRFKD